MGAVWTKIYSPVDITINRVSCGSCTTPAKNNIKYICKSEYVPVTYSYQANVGVGKSYHAWATKYDYKPGPSTIKFENTPANTFYSIKIDGKPDDVQIICMSKSRQHEIMQYLESKNHIRVKFLLGMPIIPEINYNAWFESPLLFITLSIPTLILTIAALQFV